MVRLTILLLLLPAVLTMSFVGCQQMEVAEEETDKGEIVIGILDDLSGPASDNMLPRMEGTIDCIRYLNEENQGVLGHPIRAVVIDYKMDHALMRDGWSELKEEGAVLIISTLAGQLAFLQEACQTDRIPTVCGGGSFDQNFPKEPSYLFSSAPTRADSSVRPFCDCIEKDWAEKGEYGNPRIGFAFVTFGNIAKMFGKAAKMYTEERGWEYVLTPTSLVPKDVSSQVLKMEEFECDYVLIQGTSDHGIAFLKEFDRQDFHPGIFGPTSAIGTRETWNAVGERLVGAICWHQCVIWEETDVPLVALVHELNARWHPKVTERHYAYLRAFSDFLVLSEALERAINEAGYENLDGEAMKEAMETIRDFDPGLGTGYTWTTTDHQGIQGNRWYRWIEDGTLESIGGWSVREDPPTEEQKTDAWWLAD